MRVTGVSKKIKIFSIDFSRSKMPKHFVKISWKFLRYSFHSIVIFVDGRVSIGDLKGKLLGNELESSQVSKRYGLQQVRLIEDTDIVIMEKVERFM